MSKKTTFNLKTLILCAVIIVGLVLTIIGMFGNFLKSETTVLGSKIVSTSTLSDLADANKTLKEYDSSYEGFAATNIFAWATFILAIVVTVVFAVAKFIGVKGLDMIVSLVGCLTVVAAILVFVFAIIMANKHDVSIAAGPIIMLIGGILAGGAAAASGKV